MATFAEIVTEVMEITARPDLVTLTRQSIRAAIVAAHSLQDFDRDIKEVALAGYVPPVVSTGEALEVQYHEEELPADFRQVTRVIANFGADGIRDKFVKESGSLLYRYVGSREAWTYRILGNNIRVGFVGSPVSLSIAYYGFPAIDTAAPSTDSWICAGASHEYITLHAAQRVFRSLGMADDARMLDPQLGEARADLLANYS